ncbi:MAG: PAS domain-containing hybrid sensor histidine kinase/response regulator [Planctomycetota bacterium]
MSDAPANDSKQPRPTARAVGLILGAAFGFGCLFWLVDSIYEYYYFTDHFRAMLFNQPHGFLDALILRVPPPSLLDRALVMLACLLGGVLVSVFWLKNRHNAAALRRSEADYRLLVHHQSDLVVKVDTAGRILFASDSYCRVFGRTRRELIGHPYMPLVHADDREATAAAVASLAHPPYTVTIEQRALTVNGWRWFAWVDTAIRDQTGAISAIIGVGRDITDRKQAEEQRQRAERGRADLLAEMQLVFDHMPLACVRLDRAGQCAYANSQARRLFAVGPQGLEPDGILAVLEARDRQRVAELLPPEHHPETPARMVVTVRPDDAGPMRCEWQVVPLQGTDGGVLILAEDISERLSMELQLRQAEKLQAVGQLAGGIAHDFNNQLAGIMGFAEILVQRLGDDQRREPAEKIVLAARCAADLTRQLLAFSRKGNYVSVPVDAVALVHEVGVLLTHSIDKRITIAYEHGDEPLLVDGDPSQLQNAVLNLALNARDAMPDGGQMTLAAHGEHLSAAACARLGDAVRPGDHVRIEVRDTGIGIEPTVRQHMFEPFFTTKPPGRGTGMGLAAVYGTMAAHHGAIRVDSEPGQGSCFVCLLPRSSARTSEHAPPAPRAEIGTAGAHVLLVDDDAVVREALAALLRDNRLRVACCHDGAAAVHCVRTHADLDLVLLDMMMPGLDGPACFKALRDLRPELPVILISGYSLDDQTQALLDAGARDFLQKPVAAQALLARIHAVLTHDSDRAPADTGR